MRGDFHFGEQARGVGQFLGEVAGIPRTKSLGFRTELKLFAEHGNPCRDTWIDGQPIEQVVILLS